MKYKGRNCNEDRLAASRLREVWGYDPNTGLFTRREKQKGGSVSASGEPGAVSSQGYRILSIDGTHYLAHRLAWLYVTGEWPERMVRHVNGNKLDNRWSNFELRKSKEDNRAAKLTQARIKEVLSYEPETGVFRHLVNSPRARAGEEAGVIDGTGYRHMSIDGKRYLAHRAAWFWVHGTWPTRFIDHKNGNPADNRLINLREASDSQNAINASIRSTNTSGYLGVTYVKSKKKWLAYTTKNYRRINLGYFDTKEAANAHRVEAIKKIHGEFGSGQIKPVIQNPYTLGSDPSALTTYAGTSVPRLM